MTSLNQTALKAARDALFMRWSGGDYDEAMPLASAAVRAYLDALPAAPLPEEVERAIAEWTEAAKGVTPGEWLYCVYGTVVFKLPTMTPKGDLGFIATTIDDWLDEDDVDYPTTEARARWIARCSPDGIRSLLALLTQQAQALADANARIGEMEADKSLLLGVIAFAIDCDDPATFLRCWTDGSADEDDEWADWQAFKSNLVLDGKAAKQPLGGNNNAD